MKVMVSMVLALAVFANIGTLKDGHNWGDDFAQYIINAQNIIEAKPFNSGVMLENVVIYPPGLPLLLAPILKAAGLNFKAFKFINILFWFLSLIFIYSLLRRRAGGPWAVMGAVFLAFSSYFFVYKQNVLSDIPFFCAVCACFYLLEEGNFAGFIAAITAALWLRSAGVILFAAGLFYFLFIKHDRKAAAIIFTALLINEFVLWCWMGWHPGLFGVMLNDPYAFLHNVLNNFVTVFQAVWYFLCPAQTIFSQWLFHCLAPWVSFVAPLLYASMAWSLVRGFQKKSITCLECFSFFYITVLIVESGYSQPPDAFTRFILPLLPAILIGALRLPGMVIKLILGVLLLVNASNIIVNWDFNDDVLSLPVNAQLTDWVKQHTRPDERFMFCKPRALALLTGREGTAPWVLPEQEGHFVQRVRDFGITQVISLKDNDPRGLTAGLEKSSMFKQVWENAGYKVFEPNIKK